MPRKTSSSYWTAMDFGSEDEDSTMVPSKNPTTRVYVDPWDLENYAFMRRHLEGTPEPQSPAGEPASSSTFYYISKEEHELLNHHHHHQPLQRTLPSADSPTLFAGIDELDFHNENFEVPYYELSRGIDRRRQSEDFMMERKFIVPRPTLTDTGSSLSSGNENYVYSMTDVCDPTSPDASLVYVYETATRKRKIALPKSARRASSNGNQAVRKFRRMRNSECLDCRLVDNGGYSDGFENDMHMVPLKPPPENFGLSSYGHLKIDYSCSWHSLDKLIRSE